MTLKDKIAALRIKDLRDANDTFGNAPDANPTPTTIKGAQRLAARMQKVRGRAENNKYVEKKVLLGEYPRTPLR